MIILSENIGLESIERLYMRLLDTPSKRYVTVERDKGKHCITINFDNNTPPNIIREIHYDMENGRYPGLLIFDDKYKRNLFNLHICLDKCYKEKTYCYLDECYPYED